jgi:hypothetical protein
MKLGVLVGLLSMVACSDVGNGDGDGDGDVDPLPDAAAAGIRVFGTINGVEARAGDVNGLFIVGIGQVGLYAGGLGRSVDGSTYSLPMPTIPSTESQNNSTTATAFIVLTEIDDSFDEGRVEGSDQSKIIGLASDVMVVYNGAPFVDAFGWESQFPAGWSCGVCQRSPVEGVADTLDPRSDCNDVPITMGTFNTVDSCDLFGD